MQLGPRGAQDRPLESRNSNYGKPAFQSHEPKTTLSKQDEIPVIEENYTPPANDDPKIQKQFPLKTTPPTKST